MDRYRNHSALVPSSTLNPIAKEQPRGHSSEYRNGSSGSGSFIQRRGAVRDARDVDGVRYVYDDLSVRLLDAAQRSDGELRVINP